jgi:hypothetical protein
MASSSQTPISTHNPQPKMCCTLEGLDTKILTLPKMVVIGHRPVGQLNLTLTHRTAPRLAWNPATCTFDYEGGSTEISISETPAIAKPMPNAEEVVEVTATDPIIINGQVMSQWTWTYANGQVFSAYVVLWNRTVFVFMGRWLSHSNDLADPSPWVPSGPPPEASRIATPPPSSGGGGGGGVLLN